MYYLRVHENKPTLILQNLNRIQKDKCINSLRIIKFIDESLINKADKEDNVYYWRVNWPDMNDNIADAVYTELTEQIMMEYL